MEKEKIIGIKIFGWFFIILSFLCWFTIPEIISSYYKVYSTTIGLPKNINFLPTLSIYSIIFTLIGFFIYFVTGIGILKIKRWAYYLALCIPAMYFVGTIKSIWLFGPQSVIGLSTFSTLFISIIIILFLMRKGIIEQFNADYVTKRGKRLNPKKFVVWLSIIGVLLNVIPIAFWMLLVNVKFKDQLPIINLKPRQIEYRIEDKNFILNSCERRDVFDYNIYIPKDCKIGMISMEDSGFGWNLSFLDMENSNLKAFIMLDNKGFGRSLLPISEVLNFNTVYDFEKTINYPNWTPIYLILKIVGSRNLTSIDEATTSTWRGFVKVIKSKETNIYDGSLYSLKRNKTCSITVLFKDGVITSEQAKSIITSLEFKATDGNCESLFEEGKINLSNGDFSSATLNFMNALYLNEQNPEYAYYLARSLFEDVSIVGRGARLDSAKKFLEYALKLNPNSQKAEALLVSVDTEIKKTKENKKE